MPHNVPRERIILFGLAALMVVALIFGVVSSGISAGQRDAWMEGYTMGRLTAAAGVDGAVAPVAPYAAPYAMGYRGHGPGFGGFLFILLAAGAVFFVVSRMVRIAHWHKWAAMQGGPQGWQGGWPQCTPQAGAQGGTQGGPQADWHQGPPPWMRGRWGCGPWGAPWEQPEQAQQPQQAQAAQPVQTPAQEPGQASDQPAAER